ncbi:MAG: DUF1552 domain-containing protein [Myxococcota bacterium]
MYKLSRRQLNIGAGAGLLLAPFLSMLNAGPTGAAPTKQAKRLLLFCTMGTKPDLWTPKVSGESITGFSAMTAPLADVKDNIVLVEGLPSGNPSNNHGAPDGITGMGYGYYAVNGVQQLLISLDQFVADKLVKGGINRPIASLLLGSETGTGGATMFYRGGKNLLPIASPSSAFSTVFGNVTSGTSGGTSTTPDLALKRRQSILDLVSSEIRTVQGKVGSSDKAKLESHLESIRALENKLSQQMSSSGTTNSMAAAACKGLTKPSDSTNKAPAIANNLLHMDIMVNALACDITRVAAIQFGTDQALQVDLPGLQGDQHNGFIHSGAPDFKNLIAFEVWLSQQFAKLIAALKSKPDPDGSGGTLFDSTLVVWARDMGDAVDHNMKDMRFVLAAATGGCLKLASGGRYLKASGERHERVLLSALQAMGINDFTGFGDPGLSNKTPLAGIVAT